MYKLLLFNSYKNKGLTLVEVLIATLIVVVFITVSLQALTVAALFKSRGKVQIDAINWIQQDLEEVRRVASNLPNSANCKPTVSTGGYGQALETALGGTTTQTKSIAGTDYDRVRTVTVSGGTPPPSGTCQLNACYETLRLNYKVKGRGAQSSLILTDVETEVIPNAVFQCPL